MSVRALLYRRPSEPSVVQVIFDQAIYPVRLRRHRQARRYTLRIDAASREVVLTMPPRGSVKEAKEFAQKHGGWIAARLKRLPEAAPFAHGLEVPLRGEAHRVPDRPERSDVGRVRNDDDEAGIRVVLEPRATDEGDGALSRSVPREHERARSAERRGGEQKRPGV